MTEAAQEEAGAEPEDAPPRPTRSEWVTAALALGLLLLYLYLTAIPTAIRSPDVSWHLNSGRAIAAAGEVLDRDPFCFTTEGVEWINHNWLSQVALYGVFRARGFPGLFCLEAFLFVAALAAFLLLLRAREVSPLLGLVALALTLYVLNPVKGLRPRALTWVFLLTSAWILARPDPEERFSWRRAGALLGILLVWNNVHGGFVYGYALLGTDALGTTLQARWQRGTWVTRRAGLLGLVIALGLLGFALHPHGFAAPLYAARYTSALGVSMQHTVELLPIDFTSTIGRFVEVYLLLLAVGIYLAPRRPHLRDLLLIGVFVHLTLIVVRGVVPLVLLTAPIAASTWGQLLERASLDKLRAAEARFALGWRWLPVGLLVASGLWLGGSALLRGEAGTPGDVGAGWDDMECAGAVRWIASSKAPGRIFNFYDSGGLLGWALSPERRVYLDSRGDLHTRSGCYSRYLAVLDTGPGWKEHLDEQQIDLVVMPLPPRQPPYLLRALTRQHGWKMVYADDAYAVVQRPPGERSR